MWKVKQVHCQKSLIHPLALPFPSSVILGESLHFSQLLFSHCKMVTPLTDLSTADLQAHLSYWTQIFFPISESLTKT